MVLPAKVKIHKALKKSGRFVLFIMILARCLKLVARSFINCSKIMGFYLLYQQTALLKCITFGL